MHEKYDRKSKSSTAEYPSINLHKNNVYCILTRSSKNAAKFKQQWRGIQQLLQKFANLSDHSSDTLDLPLQLNSFPVELFNRPYSTRFCVAGYINLLAYVL